MIYEALVNFIVHEKELLVFVRAPKPSLSFLLRLQLCYVFVEAVQTAKQLNAKVKANFELRDYVKFGECLRRRNKAKSLKCAPVINLDDNTLP